MTESPALRSGSLTFLEVLATSVALIGPSMTPILIAPYMYANAGNGTWLAYAFGGTMLVFVALNINQFARRSSAAGSMYGYVAENLGPMLGAIAGWSLLWAYGFVAAAVLGAMALFTQILFSYAGIHVPAIAIVCAIALAAWQAAYRGVAVSAIVMLVLEAISVAIICLLVAIVLVKHGPSIDVAQLKLQGGFPGGIGLAIMFAVFSFVGFESATAFGAEAKQSAGHDPAGRHRQRRFRQHLLYRRDVRRDSRTAPRVVVVRQANVSARDPGEYLRRRLLARPDYDWSALQRLFRLPRVHHDGGTRRVRDGRDRPASPGLCPHRTQTRHAQRRRHRRHRPDAAGDRRGRCSGDVAPIDVFNNCGTLSSFGFVVIYAMISIAAGVYVKRRGEMRWTDLAVSVAAVVLLLVPTVMLFYSVPAPPQRWFVYYFLIFLAAGWAWFAATRRRDPPGQANSA